MFGVNCLPSGSSSNKIPNAKSGIYEELKEFDSRALERIFISTRSSALVLGEGWVGGACGAPSLKEMKGS